jgi:RES domain-containing protein
MVYDREIVARLEEMTPVIWQGVAFRHMFGSFPPERQNTGGARWNPPLTAAIHTSLERETALAEAEYYINLQPLRPRVARRVYRITISLHSVIDLSDWDKLAAFEIGKDEFSQTNRQRTSGSKRWISTKFPWKNKSL